MMMMTMMMVVVVVVVVVEVVMMMLALKMQKMLCQDNEDSDDGSLHDCHVSSYINIVQVINQQCSYEEKMNEILIRNICLYMKRQKKV